MSGAKFQPSASNHSKYEKAGGQQDAVFGNGTAATAGRMDTVCVKETDAPTSRVNSRSKVSA